MRLPRRSTTEAANATGAPRPFVIGRNWMTTPTLAESSGELPLSGVSFYQAAILAAAEGRRAEGPNTALVCAQFDIVTDGQYSGAVRAYIGGQEVGSIPHGSVETIRPTIAGLLDSGRPAICRAVIYGGGRNREGTDWLNFGVGVLADITNPGSAHPGSPFLPPVHYIRVGIELATAKQLDESMHSKAKKKRVVTTGTLRPHAGGWQLELDGAIVGRLEPAFQTELDAVYQASYAGAPLTCYVRLVREVGAVFQVAVSVP